jgi:hypothetical protein
MNRRPPCWCTNADLTRSNRDRPTEFSIITVENEAPQRTNLSQVGFQDIVMVFAPHAKRLMHGAHGFSLGWNS